MADRLTFRNVVGRNFLTYSTEKNREIQDTFLFHGWIVMSFAMLIPKVRPVERLLLDGARLTVTMNWEMAMNDDSKYFICHLTETRELDFSILLIPKNQC